MWAAFVYARACATVRVPVCMCAKMRARARINRPHIRKVRMQGLPCQRRSVPPLQHGSDRARAIYLLPPEQAPRPPTAFKTGPDRLRPADHQHPSPRRKCEIDVENSGVGVPPREPRLAGVASSLPSNVARAGSSHAGPLSESVTSDRPRPIPRTLKHQRTALRFRAGPAALKAAAVMRAASFEALASILADDWSTPEPRCPSRCPRMASRCVSITQSQSPSSNGQAGSGQGRLMPRVSRFQHQPLPCFISVSFLLDHCAIFRGDFGVGVGVGVYCCHNAVFLVSSGGTARRGKSHLIIYNVADSYR